MWRLVDVGCGRCTHLLSYHPWCCALVDLVGEQVVAAVVITVQLAGLGATSQGTGSKSCCLGGLTTVAAQLTEGRKANIVAGMDVTGTSYRCRKKRGNHSP